MINAFVRDPPYIGKHKTGGIDLWGIGFLALGFGMLQVVLDTGQRKDWFGSTQIRLWTALCVFGLVAHGDPRADRRNTPSSTCAC